MGPTLFGLLVPLLQGLVSQVIHLVVFPVLGFDHPAEFLMFDHFDELLDRTFPHFGIL